MDVKLDNEKAGYFSVIDRNSNVGESIRHGASPDISAEKAVVLDMNTMEVLYDKQMNEKSSVASITKIVTAFVALEHGSLDDPSTYIKKKHR